MNFYDNDVISDIWTSPNGKIVIRKIDEFVDNIPNVVSRFITLNTFSSSNKYSFIKRDNFYFLHMNISL